MTINPPLCYLHVFARIQGIIGGSNNHWEGFCPAHSDHVKRSLSLRINKNGKLIVKCMAPSRCRTLDILQAIGLRFDDLHEDNEYFTGEPYRVIITNTKRKDMQPQPSTAQYAKSNHIATYAYRTAEGELLYEVLRYDPKAFKQRRPNPLFDPTRPISQENKPNIWNLDDTPRVLYKLPELLQTLQNKVLPVCIVEGEKSADRLWGMGVAATCCPGGAGKWAYVQEMAKDLFAGAKLIVFSDADQPGRFHARQVFDYLKEVAGEIHHISVYDDDSGRDIYDWLEENTSGMDHKGARGALWAFVKKAIYAVPKPVPANVESMLQSPRLRTSEAKVLDAQEIVKTALNYYIEQEKQHGPCASTDELFGHLFRHWTNVQTDYLECNPAGLQRSLNMLTGVCLSGLAMLQSKKEIVNVSEGRSDKG